MAYEITVTADIGPGPAKPIRWRRPKIAGLQGWTWDAEAGDFHRRNRMDDTTEWMGYAGPWEAA